MGAKLGAATLVAVVALAATNAWGDAGGVIAVGSAGPFEVSVLVSPMPLRVGTSQWSVLVRRPVDGEIVLDAEVALDAWAPHDSDLLHHPPKVRPSGETLRGASSNRLLYSRGVDLSSPGIWRIAVHVRHAEEAGDLAFDVPVAPAASPLAQHWRAFAIPPTALVLFALHQSLALRRAPRRRRAVIRGT